MGTKKRRVKIESVARIRHGLDTINQTKNRGQTNMGTNAKNIGEDAIFSERFGEIRPEEMAGRFAPKSAKQRESETAAERTRKEAFALSMFDRMGLAGKAERAIKKRSLSELRAVRANAIALAHVRREAIFSEVTRGEILATEYREKITEELRFCENVLATVAPYIADAEEAERSEQWREVSRQFSTVCRELERVSDRLAELEEMAAKIAANFAALDTVATSKKGGQTVMEFHPASIAEAMEFARSEGDTSELRAVRAWLNERAKDALNSLFLDRQKRGGF